MFFDLRTDDQRPIYVQIMDEVRRGVATGILQPDDPLPSVRRLAGDLRVNPNTVARAYRELERESTVYVRRGQGTFIARVDSAAERRSTFRHQVAERALRDAYRHGLDAEELILAIRGANDPLPHRQSVPGEQ